MKITETEKENIKIVMSMEHINALHNLLDVLEIEKFATKEGSYKLLDLGRHLEVKNI